MTKLVKLALLVFLCMSIFSGCFLVKAYDSATLAGRTANEYADIIMECFETGETEKLESIFCAKSRTEYDIKSQLEAAVEFIDGNIVDEGYKHSMTDSRESWREGVKTMSAYSPAIKDIKTDAGKTYSIAYCGYVIYADNENYVGITYLKVTDRTDETITYPNHPRVEVGYAW